ncbi:MAG: radical SAM family heme chaperone HemW [Longicatena sp.]
MKQFMCKGEIMDACYLHVPFCKDICSYCDFTRCRYHDVVSEKWLTRICLDIPKKLAHKKLATCYIGGGTPSVLTFAQLTTLLIALKPYTQEVSEYTIEANIDSLSIDKIESLHKFGVNRISLGVQTLQPKLLKIINRQHSKKMIVETIADLKKQGITNISIDLMYGLPQQTLAMWKADLQQVIEEFDIQHISLYALSIEEHSAFGRANVKQMDAQLEADMYEYAIAFLEENGFTHYEISNFAKVGYASQHNQVYWKYGDFIGIGCGASGKENHMRYDNTKNIQTYIEQGEQAENIMLSKQDEMFEMIMMSLRMKQGLSLKQFEDAFQESIEVCYKQAIQQNVKKGFVKIKNGYLCTTYQGMLYLNDVLLAFMQ